MQVVPKRLKRALVFNLSEIRRHCKLQKYSKCRGNIPAINLKIYTFKLFIWSLISNNLKTHFCALKNKELNIVFSNDQISPSYDTLNSMKFPSIHELRNPLPVF